MNLLAPSTALTFEPTRCAPALQPGEVHLWLGDLRIDVREGEAPLLEPERARAARFRFDADRQRFIASRVILKQILSEYLDLSPAELQFEHNAFGKPSLRGTTLRFNLSHSDHVLLLGITHGRELGVDVEAIREQLHYEMLAEHYFPPEQQWELRTAPAHEKVRTFFRLWTQTEATLKALGTGFGHDATDRATSALTLISFEPAPHFTGALAYDGEPHRISSFQWVN